MVSGLEPGYKWTNPTYPTSNWDSKAFPKLDEPMNAHEIPMINN